ISSLADTLVLMRASSPFFSRNEMNSPNVALGMAQNVKRHAPGEQTARSFHHFCRKRHSLAALAGRFQPLINIQYILRLRHIRSQSRPARENPHQMPVAIDHRRTAEPRETWRRREIEMNLLLVQFKHV